jgi:hypothetical protein
MSCVLGSVLLSPHEAFEDRLVPADGSHHRTVRVLLAGLNVDSAGLLALRGQLVVEAVLVVAVRSLQAPLGELEVCLPVAATKCL